MYKSNIYPKMVLLVSFFMLALNSVFAQPSIEFKLQLVDPDTWCVFARPKGVAPTTQLIPGTAQATVVMPLNYGWTGLQSVSGTWNANASVHGPSEKDSVSYISFGMIADVPRLTLTAGNETMLFCFSRQTSAPCPDSMYLIPIDDPFDPNYPDATPGVNSAGSNPGNEMTIFDATNLNVYEFLDIYSPQAWSCKDCDGDGILDPFEDTDGDGDYDGVLEDINGDGNLDVNEDLNGDNTFQTGEDIDHDGNLDIDEDLDDDNVRDSNEPDVDGDGRLDLVNEDLTKPTTSYAYDNGYLDLFEDLDNDGTFDLVNEDLDSDGYLDPDASHLCDPCDPYHTESASLELVSGFSAICANDIGDTACFKVHITGHWPPYDVEWTDGVDTFTTMNIDSADIICYVPDSSVSISILSIVDSFNCLLDTFLGAPIVIEVHGPISIGDEPDDVVECYGNGTTFCIDTVNAGDGQIFMKWQVNTGSGWADINDGALYDDTDSLCLEVVDVADKHGWQFRAKIFTEVCDTVFSNAALLEVEGPLSFDAHPVDFTNCATETASFSATPVNDGAVGTMVYQWEISSTGLAGSWSPISGATAGATFLNFNATTLNLSALTIALDGYYFRLQVSTGECSYVYSNAARLNVEGAITIADHPDNISNCAGNEVYFIADYNNAGSTYPANQDLTITNHYWQINTGTGWTTLTAGAGPYTGITGINTGASGDNDTLTISNVLNLDGYQYRICYTSPTCSTPVCSNGATLEVSGNVEFSVHPQNATFCDGGDTTFFATAAIPQGTFRFGWEYSDDNGVTWDTIAWTNPNFSHSETGTVASGTDTLTVSNASYMNNGRRFRAIAYATDCGAVYSEYAIMSIQGPLSVADEPDPVTECYGNSTSFTATIENLGVVGSSMVHWQYNTGSGWVDMPTNQTANFGGVTSINPTTGVTTLTITNVANPGHGTQFRVAYWTSFCNVQYSNAALLSVEGPITVTDQPDHFDLCAGEVATFTSAADLGTGGTVARQWQVSYNDGTSWTDITAATVGAGAYNVFSGYNGATLTVNTADTLLYSACFRIAYSTAECARVFSDRACLNIDGPISFTDHPDDIIQCSGEAVLFCATVLNTSDEADSLEQVQYNWQEDTGIGWVDLVDDTLYNGVLTNCLSIAYTSDMDGNKYRLMAWTNDCDTIYSNFATVDVEGPMTVLDEPDNVSECSGSGVTFSATVALENGNPATLIYQWEVSPWIPSNPLIPAGPGAYGPWTDVPNAAPYSGQTTTTLAISDVANLYKYRYRMRYRTPNCNAQWTNYAEVTVHGPIAVTNHPDHKTICSGNGTTFCVQTANTGQGVITYQWQVNMVGDTISPGSDTLNWIDLNNNTLQNGVYSSCLSISNVAGRNGFYYRCLIQTSECSTVISYAAVLTVEGPIGFDDHPDDITQCSAEGVSFTAIDTIAAGNSGTLSHYWQWSSNGIHWDTIPSSEMGAPHFMTGLDSTTLSIANVVGLGGWRFRMASQSGVCNEIYSFPAMLTVEGPLSIIVQPTDYTNCSNEEAFFASEVNTGVGIDGNTYRQWEMSSNNGTTWTPITQLTYVVAGNTINFAGYDSDTLLISPIIGLNGYLFRNNFWTGTCDTVTTNSARLTVEGPITFTDQPDDVLACFGDTIRYTVAIANATGAGTVQYQWQRWNVGGWQDLAVSAPYTGSFTNQLTIYPPYTSALYNAKFRCRVKTGNCEWTDSDQANLFLEGPIQIPLQPRDTSICSNKLHVFNTTIVNPGYGQMTYRWQYRSSSAGVWANFPSASGTLSTIGVTNPEHPDAQWHGAFGQDLTLTNVDGMNGYQFRIVISMQICGGTTNTATLTVRDKCLAGDCDLDDDGIINSADPDDDNDQVTDFWEAWMTTNNLQVATDTFIGTGPWYYTVAGDTAITPVFPDAHISYNRCLVDTDGDGEYDNQEDPDHDNLQNGEETDGDGVFDGNPLDPCNPVLGPTCIGINLAIKVRLQGARLTPSGATDQFMRSTLRAYGASTGNPNGTRLIPSQEPYEDMNTFTHTGLDGGGDEVVTDSTTVFAVSDSNAIVDWVFVELRSSSNLDEVVTTRSGLLQRDGDVVDLDGVSHLRFPTANAGSFYVSVRHRNHLGVMSAEAIDLSPILQEIDFTDPSFVTNGNSPQIQIGNKMYMWAGDLNSDGRTIYQGPGNDILKLFITVLNDPANADRIANFISQGYLEADVNLDGRAIYQGPNNDRSMLLLNTILKHPQNVNLISNYVILEQLP